MRIGQLAKMAGVNVETVRYYQRIGLLVEPEVPDSGYREYTPSHLEKLIAIRKAKELGFSLTEIRQIESLRVGPDCCKSVCRLAEQTLARVRDKLARLQELEKNLEALLESQRSQPHCVVLKSLER